MAKIYTLGAGQSLVDEVLAAALRDGIDTARFEAIGGVDRVTIAYFNHLTKKYEEHSFEEFLEVTGLLGNITLKDGKPFLHAHGTFGRRDLSSLGGHLMSARVFPLLEFVLTPTTNRAVREFDEALGLNIIKKLEQ